MLLRKKLNVLPLLVVEVGDRLYWVLIVLLMLSFLRASMANILFASSTVELVLEVVILAKWQRVYFV